MEELKRKMLDNNISYYYFYDALEQENEKFAKKHGIYPNVLRISRNLYTTCFLDIVYRNRDIVLRNKILGLKIIIDEKIDDEFCLEVVSDELI